jgi:hypothetical protein
VRHSVARAASADPGRLDEGQDPLGPVRLVAEPNQVGIRSLEVQVTPEEGEAQDSGVEIQAALAVGRDSRDVVYTVESHRLLVLEFLDQ